MLRLILPLVLSLLYGSLKAQDRPEKLKGLLWEISGHGITRPGYLYGTMHVPEKLAFNLSDSFFIALKQTDMVALETDHDQWQAFTEMLEAQESDHLDGGFEQSNIRHSTQGDLYNDLFAFPTPDNQLLGAILSARPRMTNEFLYRSNQYRQDYEEDTYLDLFIFQAGRKLGKKVIGLETLEGSYEAYVRAQLPDEEAEDDGDRSYYPGLFDRTTIEEAYRNQDLSLLDSLNKMMSPGKNFQRWMQDERNLIMARRIDSVLQSGTALFSAVGAAHLPGEAGLIRMLRQKGYTLRPVQFSAQNSKAVKDSIDALHYPVAFSRQWPADSTWSAEAPGTFFQTMEMPGLEQQLCTDMSNGAYYAVYHIQTYGLWNGQSPAYIAERLDSMIYEKIPGKIQERKRLGEPFPGHEITTRTRRGDIIRYKILVTPFNVFLFATGGNGNYALGTEGTQFLNSIRFNATPPAPAGASFDLHPPQGGFRVRFPAAPFINTTADLEAGRRLAAAADPTDSSVYLLYRADFHDWDYIEEDSFELNIIGEKIAAAFTKQAPVMRQLAGKPFPMQDVSFRSDRDSAYYFLRLAIDGPRYYLLGCRKRTSVAPLSFFESFAIEPVRYPDDWTVITDSAVMFRARVPAPVATSRPPFVLRLRKIVEEGLRKNKQEDIFPWQEPGTKVRYMRLPLQGEEVFIFSKDMFRLRNLPTADSLQRLLQNMLTNDKKLILKDVQWDNVSPRLMSGKFLLADTNSTRGIRARALATPGRIYLLSATVQLEAPESEFIRTVMDGFEPADTTSGDIPFGGRNRSWLQNIYAADSLVRKKALEELGSAWQRFESRDFPALCAAVGHPDFGKLRYHHRELLLSYIGNSEHPGALNYLQTFFDRYPDSARYRQTVLRFMAEMQTGPAFKTVLKRLNREPVYLTDEGQRGLFGRFEDTLQLTAKMYRDFLRLSRQTEFREMSLDLIEKLARKKMIRPADYARIIPGLIKETGLSLQKLRYNAEMKDHSDASLARYYGGYTPDPGGVPAILGRNLRLLAPFISKNARVKNLFLDATRSPEKIVGITAWCLLLKHGQAVPAETLRAYTEDDRTRIHLYRQLAGAGLASSYSAWFSDTIALLRSILVDEARDQIREPDSIRFRSRHQTSRWNRPALLYFFEVKKKKEQNWSLACLTVPASNLIFGANPSNEDSRDDYFRFRDRPDVDVLPELPETEKETFIRKKIGEIRFANRERYRKNRL